MKIALVMPGGQRITAEKAEAAGLNWSEGYYEPEGSISELIDGYYAPPLRIKDSRYAEIAFQAAGAAGRYVIELTSPALKTPATARAWFNSRMDDYALLIGFIPGARLSKAFPLNPSASVSFEIQRDEQLCAFDIVVPNSSVKVSLTLPDGHLLRPETPTEKKFAWETIEAGGSGGAPGEGFSLGSALATAGSLMPVPGIHHVIFFEKVAEGRYEIHATGEGIGGGELRAAFLRLPGPLDRKRVMEARLRARGEVRLRPQRLPHTCYVGDKLDVVVELLGDVGDEQPRFELRSERSAFLRATDSGVQMAPPDPIETTPVQLARGPDGAFHGTVAPAKPGMVRISVRARGKTASGLPFTSEALIADGSINVNPIVARFLSLDASAIDVDGDSKLDRLDVTATLDVFEPGEYQMGFTVRDAAGARLQAPGKFGPPALHTGRQSLTVSLAASQIWTALRDGPLQIENVDIWRTHRSTSLWVRVPTGGASFRTAAYRRDQWNPGPIYGEDHVSVHGIRPAPSGRFRFAEVEWEVTTPGGSCEWEAVLDRSASSPGAELLRLTATVSGGLPPGRTKVSFVFDGAAIAVPGAHDWLLHGGISCGKGRETALRFHLNDAARGSVTLQLDPDQYEPAHATFRVRTANAMTHISAGSSGSNSVYAVHRSSESVQFRVEHVPAKVEVRLLAAYVGPQVAGADLQVEAAPDAAAGRYFLEIAATSGAETATTELVLDVTAPLPTVAAVFPECKGGDLDITFQFADSPDHHRTVALNVRNLSRLTCTLKYPRNEPYLPTDSQAPVKVCLSCGPGGVSRPAKPFVLAPGAVVHRIHRWKTVPGGGTAQRCVQPHLLYTTITEGGSASVRLASPSLLRKICSVVEVGPYLPGPFAESVPPRVLTLSAPKTAYYSSERVRLQVTGDRPPGRPPVDGRACPTLFQRHRYPNGETDLEEIARSDGFPCRAIPGGTMPSKPRLAIDFDSGYAGVWRDLGDHTVEVFEVVGAGQQGELLMAFSNSLRLHVTSASNIERAWGRTVEGVAVGVALDKSTYELGEDIPLHIGMENVAAVVPLFGPDPQSRPCDIVRIEVRDSGGQLVTVSNRPPCPSFGWNCRFTYVKGKVVPLERTLVQEGLLPARPGAYTVVVTWSPCTRPVECGSPGTLAPATGQICAVAQSAPVTFYIVDR
ncbi:MAG: hypothetical protein ABSD27_04750 [Bryobacteraceae bacterium]